MQQPKKQPSAYCSRLKSVRAGKVAKVGPLGKEVHAADVAGGISGGIEHSIVLNRRATGTGRVSEVPFRFFSCQASLKYHHSPAETGPLSRVSIRSRSRHPRHRSRAGQREPEIPGLFPLSTFYALQALATGLCCSHRLLNARSSSSKVQSQQSSREKGKAPVP